MKRGITFHFFAEDRVHFLANQDRRRSAGVRAGRHGGTVPRLQQEEPSGGRGASAAGRDEGDDGNGTDAWRRSFRPEC